MNKNITPHNLSIGLEQRNALYQHRSIFLLLTGFSGSGKSTLAYAVEKELYKLGCKTVVLDGDNIRHGLCSDLSFSIKDRKENLRRVGEVGKLFVDAGIVVLASFISPKKEVGIWEKGREDLDIF